MGSGPCIVGGGGQVGSDFFASPLAGGNKLLGYVLYTNFLTLLTMIFDIVIAGL